MRTLTAIIIIFLIFSSISIAHAIPSATFTKQTKYGYEEWYDSWGFNRNYYGDSDGYLPNLAYESLGNDKELAYSIGEKFKIDYPQKIRRAEEILSYVQRWTDYGYDEENVLMEGEIQEEWAWNADEMAHKIDETSYSVAIGDCEDMTFLCSTIYLAAGFDVVLVSPPDHVALMIWLPEYENANYYWDITDDDRDYGWIWVEATAETNSLGWTPPEFSDGDFEVYPISSFETLSISYSPQNPRQEDDVTITVLSPIQSDYVEKVQLHYSLNNLAYTTMTMILQGSSYQAIISNQTDGTLVKFYASLTDVEGNFLESNEYSYVVGENEIWIPEISNLPLELIMVIVVIGLIALYSLARKKLDK